MFNFKMCLLSVVLITSVSSMAAGSRCKDLGKNAMERKITSITKGSSSLLPGTNGAQSDPNTLMLWVESPFYNTGRVWMISQRDIDFILNRSKAKLTKKGSWSSTYRPKKGVASVCVTGVRKLGGASFFGWRYLGRYFVNGRKYNQKPIGQ